MKSPETIKQLAEAAVHCELLTPTCPGEIPMGQAALESGWLDHAPNYNCFGIKSYKNEYGRQLLFTKEWFTDKELKYFLGLGDSRTANLVDPSVPPRQDGRRKYKVQDWFATFACLGDCFAKRAQLFSAGRYAPIAAAYAIDKKLEKCVRSFSPIYATDPHYADTLLQIINQSDIQMALKTARSNKT
jgi:flagellum-specific peptidoglycan hydrolase FlgJ